MYEQRPGSNTHLLPSSSLRSPSSSGSSSRIEILKPDNGIALPVVALQPNTSYESVDIDTVARPYVKLQRNDLYDEEEDNADSTESGALRRGETETDPEGAYDHLQHQSGTLSINAWIDKHSEPKRESSYSHLSHTPGTTAEAHSPQDQPLDQPYATHDLLIGVSYSSVDGTLPRPPSVAYQNVTDTLSGYENVTQADASSAPHGLAQPEISDGQWSVHGADEASAPVGYEFISPADTVHPLDKDPFLLIKGGTVTSIHALESTSSPPVPAGYELIDPSETRNPLADHTYADLVGVQDNPMYPEGFEDEDGHEYNEISTSAGGYAAAESQFNLGQGW